MHNPGPTIRLTKLAKRAGCAAKQPQGFLLPLLRQFGLPSDPKLIVGCSSADDAAVYRWSDDLALVLTTDFFTPIVDVPYDFGVVAAANALSDVYAMGGKPFLALNLVGFPDDRLPVEVLGEILRGAAEKAAEAQTVIAGGHTIKSDEPIFGLCVAGTVRSDKIWTNAGAKVGDALVLTKPLGVGIITTAAKNDQDHLGAIDAAIESMSTLNKVAAEILAGFEVHAATDVTGFGLLGHLRNITAASAVSAEVWASAPAIIPAAREYVEQGIAPGGTHNNRRFIAEWATCASGLGEAMQLLLCDAQTSGGLLACVPFAQGSEAICALRDAGQKGAALIGRIADGRPGTIHVTLERAR